MLDEASVETELVVYQLKLMKLTDHYGRGERSSLMVEAQERGDALICLMEEAPLGQRQKVDYLIDRFEALRISCLS